MIDEQFYCLMWRMAEAARKYGEAMPRIRVEAGEGSLHAAMQRDSDQVEWVYGTPFGDVRVIGRAFEPAPSTAMPMAQSRPSGAL